MKHSTYYKFSQTFIPQINTYTAMHMKTYLVLHAEWEFILPGF